MNRLSLSLLACLLVCFSMKISRLVRLRWADRLRQILLSKNQLSVKPLGFASLVYYYLTLCSCRMQPQYTPVHSFFTCRLFSTLVGTRTSKEGLNQNKEKNTVTIFVIICPKIVRPFLPLEINNNLIQKAKTFNPNSSY